MGKRYYTALLITMILLSCKQNETIELMSPDNRFVFTIKSNQETELLNYNLLFDNQEIISNSTLGYQLEDSTILGSNLSVELVEKQSINKTWKPVYGEQSEYIDQYNEAIVHFTSNESKERRLSLVIRAYNEGVAFKYIFHPKNKQTGIAKELTAFNIDTKSVTWISKKAQGALKKEKFGNIEDDVVERPVLLETSDSLYIAIGEAALVDFARMKLTPGHDGFIASFDGVVSLEKVKESPWRFIMAAKSPKELLQNNYLVLNLNEPNKIDDVSWIKPGKIIREVTLTTQGGKACVDFAVRHNLQYIEFDAGWYGNENDDQSDATTVTLDPGRSKGPLDLHEVIDYADRYGIGVVLYVNRRALEKQLDEILPLFKSWGIKGVKYGFVNVGPQKWTIWLHDAVRKAAEHQLMLDIHDEYRPTGYSRTYPNLMTQEGVRGDECKPDNTMVLGTLFTRALVGAADQTNCYFAECVSAKMGSHASQMAKAVCVYSPWQFLFWYDRPKGSPHDKGGAGGSKKSIPEIEDLKFYDQLPTVWDETKVIEGYPGEYITIARRKGEEWFIGSLTASTSRNFNQKLNFLKPNTEYKVTIFSDNINLGSITNVEIENMTVNSQSIISKELKLQNGLAIILEPIEN